MDQNTKDILTMTIPAVGAIVTTVVTALVGMRVAKLHAQVASVADDVVKVKVATDGHTSMLVNAATQVARLEGKEQERGESRARAAERAIGEARASGPTITTTATNGESGLGHE